MTEQIENQVMNFLGLCMRAGRITSGQEACVDLARQEQAALVLMDAGASGNTRKRITDACHSHSVPLYELTEGSLGHAIGKKGRMVVALKPDGMAQKLLTLLADEQRL
ncbi:MAG: ribosomal L7Ae/L30e/S12e/Gadd45 family protein [Clostridia bacterium]|nr:ribosomal L7Ae/L30e/S12e/Gadd45 family protein [Clostridia bacterium]